MSKLRNQKGISPAFVLLTIVAMVSIAGFTIKYAADSQSAIEDEISLQEDLVSKSNVDIIRKGAAREKQGREGGETSDWQTYRNDQYGFEVKYPEALYLRDSWCKEELTECFVFFEEKKNEGKVAHWPSISIGMVTTDLSPREWVEKNKLNLIQIEERRTDINDIKLGKQQMPGIEFSSAAASGSSKNIVIRGHNNSSLLHFSLNFSPMGEIKKDVFDQMLSTFRFVGPDKAEEKQNGVVASADWQTYRNEKYGFEFKYPKEGEIAPVYEIMGDNLPFFVYVESPDRFSIEFEVYEPVNDEKKLSFAQFIDKNVKNYDSMQSLSLGPSAQAMKIGFKKGSIQLGDHGWVVNNKYVIFIKGSDYYIALSLNSDLEDWGLADQMLSTFRFIK